MSNIKLATVRLSFPSLFSTAMFGEQDTGKYEATFILDKVEHAEAIKAIQGQIALMMKEDLKVKLPADKICLKDGDDLGRDEYVGKMTIKASTKKRPLIINRDKTTIAEADNVIYGGCYVNAIVSLWAQNNQFGKRINASLEGIQFVKDGEPFGSGGLDVDAFDAFGEDSGADDFDF